MGASGRYAKIFGRAKSLPPPPLPLPPLYLFFTSPFPFHLLEVGPLNTARGSGGAL